MVKILLQYYTAIKSSAFSTKQKPSEIQLISDCNHKRTRVH